MLWYFPKIHTKRPIIANPTHNRTVFMKRLPTVFVKNLLIVMASAQDNAVDKAIRMSGAVKCILHVLMFYRSYASDFLAQG